MLFGILSHADVPQELIRHLGITRHGDNTVFKRGSNIEDVASWIVVDGGRWFPSLDTLSAFGFPVRDIHDLSEWENSPTHRLYLPAGWYCLTWNENPEWKVFMNREATPRLIQFCQEGGHRLYSVAVQLPGR